MKAFFALVLMNTLWAGTYTIIKIGLGTMHPLNMIFWRMGLAAFILWVYILIKKIKPNLNLHDVVRIISMGGVIAGSHILWVTGINFTNASDASLLYAFEPIWSIILASILLKERFTKAMGVGLILALIGMTILSRFFISFFGSFFTHKVALGNLLVVIGLFMESLYSILAKPIADRHSSAFIVALALLFSELFLVLPVFALEGFHFPMTAGEIIIILYLSIPCTVIGYALWVKIMRQLPVNIMLYTIFVQPITGPLIAFFVLGETLDSRIFCGGSFIICGVIFVISSYIKEKRIKPTLLMMPTAAMDRN